MKRKALLNVVTGILFGFIIAGILAFKEEVHIATKVPYPTHYAPELPESISFAGEKVPLERWDVKERLDREVLFNYYNHANVLFLLKLANRYFQ